MKKIIENLAVFDLDGTLWKENSHIEILNLYYKTNFFSSYISKGASLIFPKSYVSFLFKIYNRIPETYKKNFCLPFRSSAIELLKEKRQEGYHIVIISSAPKAIIDGAAKRLNVSYHHAKIGEKDVILKNKYMWKKLFVCTDNVTDKNLICLADTCALYATNKNINLFKRLKNTVLIREDM